MKRYSFILRFIITAVLLYIVYSTIDKKLLISIIKNPRITLLIAGLIIFIISNITGAIQWYFLIRSQKINITIYTVLKIYLIGSFFNNFLPGNIGGDVVKSYKLIKEKSQAEIVISSVVWDRITSFIILYFFSIISAFFLFNSFIFIYLVLGSIFIILIFILLILKFNFGTIFLKLSQKIPYPNIKIFVYNFFKSFKKYIIFSKEILFFYLISIITQFLKIFIQVMINYSFNFTLKLSEIYFFVPLIGIVSALPVSINGIGFREFLGKYFAIFINRNSDIISFFLTVGNILIVLGNLIGIVFLFDKKHSDKPSKS